MKIRALVQVLLASLVFALPSFSAAAFQFPAADAVEIVSVPDEYAGEVWAVARAESWTESRNTVWAHCEAVLQSYGDLSLPGIYACTEDVAAVNDRSLRELGRLAIGDTIALPLTADDAQAFNARAVMSAGTPEPQGAGIDLFVKQLAGQFEEVLAAAIANVREESGDAAAQAASVSPLIGELSKKVDGIVPQITAALAGDQRSSGWSASALITAVVIIVMLAALVVVLVLTLIRLYRRKDEQRTGITREELTEVISSNNKVLVEKIGLGRDRVVNLTNNLATMKHDRDAERDRADRLAEQVAALTKERDTMFEEEDYPFDGETYRIKPVAIVEKEKVKVKVYNTPFATGVMDYNLETHFAKALGRQPQTAAVMPLQAAAE